jgi:plastocyanin
MMFSFASIFSAIVLALPLVVLAAPAVPAAGAGLEDRSNYYPKTYKVTVGAGGKLRYDPQYVNAEVGDYVKFEL